MIQRAGGEAPLVQVLDDAGHDGGRRDDQHPLVTAQGGPVCTDHRLSASHLVQQRHGPLGRHPQDVLTLHRIGTQAPVGEGHPLDQPVQLHLPGLAL